MATKDQVYDQFLDRWVPIGQCEALTIRGVRCQRMAPKEPDAWDLCLCPQHKELSELFGGIDLVGNRTLVRDQPTEELKDLEIWRVRILAYPEDPVLLPGPYLW